MKTFRISAFTLIALSFAACGKSSSNVREKADGGNQPGDGDQQGLGGEGKSNNPDKDDPDGNDKGRDDKDGKKPNGGSDGSGGSDASGGMTATGGQGGGDPVETCPNGVELKKPTCEGITGASSVAYNCVICDEGSGTPSTLNDKVVAAYYSPWSTYQVSDIPAERVTHVIYAFAVPSYNPIGDAGWCTFPNDANHAAQIAALNQLKLEYPHLKTILSIGGWAQSLEFPRVAGSEDARSTFAKNCVDLALDNGFDGLDIDWEFPVTGGGASDVVHQSPADKQNLTLLMKRIREEFDSRDDGYLLTIDTPANRGWMDSYEFTEIIKYADWLNVMSYNFEGPWSARAGHAAPLCRAPRNPTDPNGVWSINWVIQEYLQAEKVPPEKILFGLSTYGRAWSQVEPGAQGDGLYSNEGPVSLPGDGDGQFSYQRILNEFSEANGFVRHWDDDSLSPWLYNENTKTMVSYVDPEDVANKARYVNHHGLLGVMVWDLQSDNTQGLFHSLGDGLGILHCQPDP